MEAGPYSPGEHSPAQHAAQAEHHQQASRPARACTRRTRVSPAAGRWRRLAGRSGRQWHAAQNGSAQRYSSVRTSGQQQSARSTDIGKQSSTATSRSKEAHFHATALNTWIILRSICLIYLIKVHCWYVKIKLCTFHLEVHSFIILAISTNN